MIRSSAEDALITLITAGFMGLGVAVIGMGFAAVGDDDLLLGVAQITIGVALTAMGVGTQHNREAVWGVAAIAAGLVFMAGGVMVITDHNLPGVAIVGLNPAARLVVAPGRDAGSMQNLPGKLAELGVGQLAVGRDTDTAGIGGLAPCR